MKSHCAIIVVAILCSGILFANANPLNEQRQQLGASKCTWGPSYWCSDLKSAKDCRAVRHCIQTVWEKQSVPEDHDSICQICKDMVTQARDQLRSNETLEELKEVFEGSCNLIPIKIVKKECDKLADDFIPELVEALSSQMNPDQVCSVAGLCNSAKIDQLLMEAYTKALEDNLTDESKEEIVSPIETIQPNKLSCSRCNYVGNLITNKFNKANRDDILENMLRLCGEMSSFSDACSGIVLSYFNDIYDHFKKELKSDAICHLSGTCSAKFHQHVEDPVESTEDINALVANGGDDIPCELCEQLIRHLREVLIANTTEAEFKQVLEGLCKQSKGFKDECLSIVDQYYDIIYNTLANELKEKEACFLIGICPKGTQMLSNGDIMPLLPVFPPAEIKVSIRKKLGASEPKFTEEELYSMQLPIDHLLGAANPNLLVENGQLCTLCEYLLHFIQEELSIPATEDEIKDKVNGICNKMPTTVRGKCHDFVDMYGDAVIALLIQGLNPRDVCPKMQLCPHNDQQQDIEVFSPHTIKNENMPDDETDKPTCPLCLFAVEQAQQKIKNDKSKRNIKNVLDHLCVHLPNKLKAECVDFIDTYTNELIDMLITDFKPEEICVSLKLCPKSNSFLEDLGLINDNSEDDDSSSSEESFNEISSSQELPLEIVFEKHQEGVGPNCVLCEELVKIAEKKIDKHMTKDDIEKALQHSCDKLRKNLQPKCHNFLDKYGDKIADLLLNQMEPKIICREIGLCLWNEQDDLEIDEALKYDVIAMPNKATYLRKFDRLTGEDDISVSGEPPSCVLCEFVMTKLEMELKNKTEQEEIKKTIENICNHMPKTVSKTCDKFIEQYSSAIFALIGSVPPKEICQKIMLCFPKLNNALTDEVIECGVCHGATKSLLPFYEQYLDQGDISINEMIVNACADLPAKYYEICSEMVSVYGHSILHLYQKKDKNEAHICAQIGKCFDNENSGLAFARISD